MTRQQSLTARLTNGLSLLLPGIFLLGFNIGTGSVTAMAKAGADYGMSLLWTIVASCLCTFFMINLYGRYTLVTGETALQAFRKHIHPAVGIYFIIALTAGVCGSVMGVMGIVAEICFEWSKSIVSGGIAPIYFAAFFISLVFFIFWNGRTEFFQRSLAVIVAVMAACFLINFFIMMPPPASIIKGLIPSIPQVPVGSDKGPLLVIASMVGTTVFSGLFIIRTTLVKEAGWTLKDYKNQRNDAAVSVILMFVISAAIMAAAAGTLYVEGVTLIRASQMIELLEPLAGSLAVSIFALGLVAAGVSSQFPNVLMLPWLLCDYTGSDRNMTRPRYRVMVFFISLLGLVVPIFEARPILVMIVSQAFNAVILPVTVACILYLGNRKDLMGEHKNSVATNVILCPILLFAVFTSYLGIKGVLNLILTAVFMPSKERLYITVFNKISALIREGEFPVGSRLPTERELAERFDVSRPTIREAIIALEAKEEVSVKPSSGVYVLGNHLINDEFSHEISAFELLEARVLLEGEAAALAARMIQPDEVEELEKALKKIELEDVKDTSASGADRQFHTIIAQATHNRVIGKQISFLWDLQENLKHINKAHSDVCIEEDRSKRIDDHAAIYRAIAAGDAKKARTAMREHFSDLLEAMHTASEQEAVEAAKLKVSKMRHRFKIAEVQA